MFKVEVRDGSGVVVLKVLASIIMERTYSWDEEDWNFRVNF